MADEEQHEVRKKVIYENVSASSGKQNLPVIIFVVIAAVVIAFLILTRFS